MKQTTKLSIFDPFENKNPIENLRATYPATIHQQSEA